MDQFATGSSAELVSQTTTATSSPPAPSLWLEFPETMQSLPQPQALREETHGPISYPYLDALHQFPQNTEFINDTPFGYTSSTSPVSEPSGSQQAQDTVARPAWRRENRYRNVPPSVLSRRAQNRASQRAYRERKEQRIRDLEQLLQEAYQREETLTQAYVSLRTEYERISNEKDDSSSFGTTTPVSGETMLAEFDLSSMPQSTDVLTNFDFSSDAYEYGDNTQQ
ncbi:hypothetical protein ED733_008780 [Metarhizium rileyi]|uniref:Putative transcription factor kapC n=1 Tax=Metarhizium rileyi (strain RCEF 4871) TaxID=1649241 RepID=A0A5C6GQ22_METRR|nr:hypothetical protein ED733_008780 [Metarhizium rileyi]